LNKSIENRIDGKRDTKTLEGAVSNSLSVKGSEIKEREMRQAMARLANYCWLVGRKIE
jgi:hypothetical protein